MISKFPKSGTLFIPKNDLLIPDNTMWYMNQKKFSQWSHHVCLVHTIKNLFTPKSWEWELTWLEWELTWFSVKFVPYSMNYSILVWFFLFLVWMRPINGMKLQSLGVNCTFFDVNNTLFVWLHEHDVKHTWWCESSEKVKHTFLVWNTFYFL